MRLRQYIFGTLSGALLFLIAGYLANAGIINWSLAVVGASIFAISLTSFALSWFKSTGDGELALASRASEAEGQH